MAAEGIRGTELTQASPAAAAGDVRGTDPTRAGDAAIRGTDPTQASPSGDAPTDLAPDVARAETPDSIVGSVLVGRYRIDRRLGSGGMGAVYAGTHLALDRPVAIKLIKPRFDDDPGIAQRFIQEARTASAIAHAHIVEITDFGETDQGTAFFVMERLEGEDLAATVAREGPLPWPRVVHIGEQIARALAAAHKHGVVHRDIKPANCFRLTRDDDPDFIKVLDFGLAKVVRGDNRDGLTRTGALLGTPGYIAPELYRGLPADHRVDLYALGALMFKLLTGELPPMKLTEGDSSGVDVAAIPPPLQRILRRSLAEDPAARYATAQALAADLRAMLSGTGIPLEPSGAGLSGPLLTVKTDARGISLTIGAPLLAAVIVGVGLVAFFWLRGEDLPPAEPAEVVAKAEDGGEPPVTPPPAPDNPLPVPQPPASTSTDDSDPTAADKPDPPADPPPASDPPPPTKTLPTGSPAALQKTIRRKCPSTFAYTLRVQWTAGPDGKLDTDSVKPVDPRDQLNDSQTCALRQVTRSALAWTPGKTYTHTFKIGG